MKVIDQLRTYRDGFTHVSCVSPTKYFTLEETNQVSIDIPDSKKPIYETTATLKMRALGTGAIGEEEHIRRQCAKSIARELYGDVVERLYDVIDILREEGPRYNDKVLIEIEKLTDDLLLKDYKF